MDNTVEKWVLRKVRPKTRLRLRDYEFTKTKTGLRVEGLIFVIPVEKSTDASCKSSESARHS